MPPPTGGPTAAVEEPSRPAAPAAAAAALPVAAGARVHLLDALRGLALLGILLGNIQHFSGAALPLEGTEGVAGVRWGSPALDQAARWLVDVAVEGKFYSIFSLLFGIGFAVQLSRAGDETAFLPRFRRRLTILLLIGLAHLFLLWQGDILALYALVGFCLIPFRHKPDGTLLRWAAALLAAPVLLHAVLLAVVPPLPEGAGPGGAGLAEHVALYREGSYLQILADNATNGAAGRAIYLVATGRFLKVLATFLIGLWAWRRGIVTDPAAHRPLLRRVLAAGLALGVAGNVGLAIMMRTGTYEALRPIGILQPAFYSFGVPALALAYAAGVALLWLRAPWRARLTRLAPAGRMALTNYLAQTVLAALVFYGYGLGLFGRVGLAAALGVAVAIFALQVAWSAWWLARFDYGPMEWLWRSLTYGRRLPWR